MATPEERTEYARRVGGQAAPSVPIKAIPKFADSLKFKHPDYSRGVQEMDEKLESWRKSLNFPSSSTTTTIESGVGTGGTGTGGGTKGDKGDPGVPGPPGPNRFLCPDNGQYYSIVPRLGDDGVTIGTQWVPYVGP